MASLSTPVRLLLASATLLFSRELKFILLRSVPGCELQDLFKRQLLSLLLFFFPPNRMVLKKRYIFSLVRKLNMHYW